MGVYRDPEYGVPMVPCPGLHAHVTLRSCATHQSMALTAARLIVENGMSTTLVDSRSLTMLTACGRCPISMVRIDPQVLESIIRDDIGVLLRYLEEDFDWERGEEPYQREMDRAKRYRESHRTERVVYMRQYREKRNEQKRQTQGG